MKLITTEEYLEAVSQLYRSKKIIDQYFQQAMNNVDEIGDREKIKIESFIAFYKRPENYSFLDSIERSNLTRLLNILEFAKIPEFKYIDEIQFEKFMRCRNAGIHSWRIFEKLRDSLDIKLLLDNEKKLKDNNINEEYGDIYFATKYLLKNAGIGSRSTIYKWSHEGRIPCTKRGKKLWFNRKDLEAWIESGMPNVSQKKAIEKLKN
jgi:excisionase family DNA binding protein